MESLWHRLRALPSPKSYAHWWSSAWLLNGMAKLRVPLDAAILFEQQFVDGQRGSCPFSYRYHGELHVPGYVAGHEDTRNAGLAGVIALHPAIIAERATEFFQERRARMLACIEEQCL